MHSRLLAILVVLLVLFFCFSLAQDICYPDTCADPDLDSFYSYQACCETGCCARLRYYVIPVAFVGAAFVLGAFFALCFQCR